MGAAALHRILAKLTNCVQPSPNQWQANCPIHKGGQEKDRSFGLSIDAEGRVKFNCLSGCGKEEIRAHFGEPWSELGPDTNAPRLHDPNAEPANDKLPPEYWEAKCAEWAASFATDTRARAVLADRLDVPESVFACLPLMGSHGDDPRGPCWTFPEVNAHGRVTGVSLRFKNGEKPSMARTRRALTIPLGWESLPGPLYIVEGASDVLAMMAARIAAVGRFNVDGGVHDLSEYINLHVPVERQIVWMIENDKEKVRKASREAASKLAANINRPMFSVSPPAGSKDARTWITGLIREGVQWEEVEDRKAKFWPKPKPVEPAVKQSEPVANPAPVAPVMVDGRVPIRLGKNNEKPINDLAIQALTTDPEVFARGDFLVTVIDAPAHEYRGCQFPPAPRISTLDHHVLRERLGMRTNFIATREGKEVEVLPPERVVSTIRGRKMWPGMKYLESVVEYPVIRKDGTLVCKPGYDESTGVYYAPHGEIPTVPENPTHANAWAAWNVLRETVCDFPFTGPAHESSWLAAFLTPLARFAFRGPAPMFLLEANIPGAGKGLLADTISIPLTGQEFACSAYTAEDDEMQKRVTTIAMEGDKLVLLDNISGPFGGSTVDLMLTSVRWTGRILGSNTSANVPLWATWYATGNNIQFVGDILRRICPCRLSSKLSNPEDRQEFAHQNLRQWVKDNRAKLLTAALTILRAYFVAGAPVSKDVKAWGSYEEWSRIVRNAVVWLGLVDPANAREEIRTSADGSRGGMETLIKHWGDLMPDRTGVSAGQIISRVYPDKSGLAPSHLETVSEALQALMPRPNSVALGKKLMEYRERRVMIGKEEKCVYLDCLSKKAGTGKWGVYDGSTGKVMNQSDLNRLAEMPEKGGSEEAVTIDDTNRLGT